MFRKQNIFIIPTLLSLASIIAVIYYHTTSVRYGFVNTEKMLSSFVESQKVFDDLRAEEEKWLAEKRIIEDSLVSFERDLENKYESLSIEEKIKAKKEHLNRIEELGKFNIAREKAIQALQIEKMTSVYQKINSSIQEFAKKEKLDIVFASSNGSIVYGDGSKVDVTGEFVLFLNSRYK